MKLHSNQPLNELETMTCTDHSPLGKPVPAKQILKYLEEKPDLFQQYQQLTGERKDQFLNFCTGASGLKICYDPFFKFIFNPEVHPDRLSDFLSAVLKKKVSVMQVLNSEGSRLLSEGSLIIMDILVLLENGAYANVEIQRYAYAFPGPRGACYSSDLILRQYSKARKQKNKSFSYKDLKTVYTIVILENSPSGFHQFPTEYIHHAKQKFDTGLELDLLPEYVFIPLDVFRKFLHNKSITTELEAWLSLLTFDEPEYIWQIQTRFPKFREIYHDLVDFRTNIASLH